MNEAQWRETFATRKVLWCRQPSDGSRNPPHIDGGAKGHTNVHLDEGCFWANNDLFEQAGHDLHALYLDQQSKGYGHLFDVVLATDGCILAVAKEIADLAKDESEQTISSVSVDDQNLLGLVEGKSMVLCLPYIDGCVLKQVKTLIAAVRGGGGTLSGDLFCLVHIDDGCAVKKVLGDEYQIHALVTEQRQWSASAACVLCRTGSQALVYSSVTQNQFWPTTSQKHAAPVAASAARRGKPAFA